MGCPDGLCCANIDGIMMNNDYLLGFERNAEYTIRSLARIMHRFLSRSDESADLGALRHARGHPFRVGPRKRTVRYVEEADRVQRGQVG